MTPTKRHRRNERERATDVHDPAASATDRHAQSRGLSPWAVREDALAASLATVRAVRGRPDESGASAAVTIGRRGQPLSRDVYTFATRVGPVAIIPVLGPLVSRMNWQYWSYDEIIRDLRLAESMPDITAIVLDMDSHRRDGRKHRRGG